MNAALMFEFGDRSLEAPFHIKVRQPGPGKEAFKAEPLLNYF